MIRPYAPAANLSPATPRAPPPPSSASAASRQSLFRRGYAPPPPRRPFSSSDSSAPSVRRLASSTTTPRRLQSRAPHVVSTTRAAPRATAGPRAGMLQHSLEMALEEADGFHDEQLLRRANVSPFFSSAKPTLEPIPLPLPPANRNHICSSQGGGVVAMAPLNLDSGNAFDGGTSFSRESSWCDFSLDSDLAPLPLRATPASHASAVPPNTIDAWELFLDGMTPAGGAVAFALKTPTSHDVPGFPGFFSDEPAAAAHGNGDPTAFSPTHIDKKVLVSDSDLKLDAAAHEYRALVAETPSRKCASHQVHALSARSKREKPFSRTAVATPDEATPPTTRPRRALLPDHYEVGPYDVSPGHARFVTPAVGMPRLPALSYVPHNSPRADSPCVFPLVGRNWKRTALAVTPPQQRQIPDAMAYSDAVRGRGGRATAHRQLAGDTAFTPQEYAAIFHADLFLQQHHHPHHHRSPGGRSNHGPVPRNVQPTQPTAQAAAAAPMAPKPRKLSKRKIGIYSPEARRERIRRFHEKRKQRVFHKHIKYDCRKRLANACPRVKGRFVRKHEATEAQTQEQQKQASPPPPPDGAVVEPPEAA